MKSSIQPAALISAVCFAAAILPGCDSTPNGQANQLSQQASAITRSAGDTRATDALLDKVKETGIEQDKMDALKAQVEGEAKSGHANTYISHPDPLADLKDAQARMGQALKAPQDVSPNLRSALQSQQATVSSDIAELMIAKDRGPLAQVMRDAINIHLDSQLAIALGREAAALESVAKRTAADLGDAQKNVETAKGAVADAQKVVDDIQKQIDDKRARGQQILSATDEALAKADELKGNDAITAGRKALEDRKEGEKLNEEAAALEPKLAQAKADAVITQIKQHEAEEVLKSLTSSSEQAVTASKIAADEAKSLRDRAKGIVDGEGGLASEYKKFQADVSKLTSDLKAATAEARAADEAVGNAITSYDDWKSSLESKSLDSSNPLSKVAADPHAKALLQVQQASTKELLGRALLMTASAASSSEMADRAFAAANAAAGNGAAATAPAGTTASATLYKDAADMFDKAAKTAETAMKSGVAAKSSVKWLGSAVAGLAYSGEAVADPTKTEAAKNASSNIDQAISGNPYLRPVLRP